MNRLVIVEKRDENGQKGVRYSGQLVTRGSNFICLHALFRYGDTDRGNIRMRVGDIFTEWFYSDRWYNIFRVQHGVTGELRGFYCNITRPATIRLDRVWSDDLALDCTVNQAGEMVILDEDEYQALALDSTEDMEVRAALSEIRERVARREGPFAALSGPLASY